jgi:hypothetical protein
MSSLLLITGLFVALILVACLSDTVIDDLFSRILHNN